MKHIIDTKEFISEKMLELRQKYGFLEAYGAYMIVRQLLYLQKLKSAEYEILVNLTVIHTLKPEQWVRAFLDDCISMELLSDCDLNGFRYVYHIETLVWYLSYCSERATTKMKICEMKEFDNTGIEIYETFKDIIQIDWSRFILLKRRLTKYNAEMEKKLNAEDIQETKEKKQ